MLVWRSLCFCSEALPAPPFSVQTSHPLNCTFLEGINALPPLVTRSFISSRYPGRERSQCSWPGLCCLPMARPPSWCLFPKFSATTQDLAGIPRASCQLCFPAPLVPLSRTHTSPKCTAGKQQDLLSVWTASAGIGGLKRAMKQPLPTCLPQLSSCRSLHSSPVSSFPLPPLPFVLLHSRSLMAWVFFSLNLFLSAFPPPSSSPKIIQILTPPQGWHCLSLLHHPL